MFYSFLLRSRAIAPWIAALAVPLLLIDQRFGGAAVVAYIAIGVWCVFGLHRSRRLLDWQIVWPSLLLGTYALASFGVSLLQDHQCIRWMPHYAELIFFPFLSVGLIMVRQPIRWMAVGAKFAVAYFAVIALMSVATGAERLGYGTNPVVAAYFMVLCGCLCRFDRKASPTVNLIFFYSSFIAVLATGTRIAIAFYAVMAIIDVAFAVRTKLTPKIKPPQFKLVLTGVVATVLIVGAMLQTPTARMRLAETYTEAEGAITQTGLGSLRIRSVILQTGFDTFASAPVFGAGLCRSVQNLDSAMQVVDPDLKFYFFHNMWLDALGFFGLTGFTLFCWWCFAVVRAGLPFQGKTKGGGSGTQHQLALGCLLLFIFMYGLTGSFLSNDRMIGATLLIFAALINERKRAETRAKINA